MISEAKPALFANHQLVLIHSLAISICSLLFCLDVLLPLGYAAGTTYIIVIISLMKFASSRTLLSYSALCILLTVLGFFFSVQNEVYLLAVINRVVSIVAICLTSWLMLLAKNKTEVESKTVKDNSPVIDPLAGITQDQTHSQLPRSLIVICLLLSVMPYMLNLLGFDFAIKAQGYNLIDLSKLTEHQRLNFEFNHLSGYFIYTFLEWNAVGISFFIFILAIAHYRITGQLTAPIIGLALLCSGGIDIYELMAADRFIEVTVDIEQLSPFTWVISRTFNAVILFLGICMLTIFGDEQQDNGLGLFIMPIIVFIFLSILVTVFLAHSEWLPQTVYPERFISRPWDLGPLLLFLLGGLLLLPRYYKRNPNLVVMSLMLSMVPAVLLHIHMAFGSSQLFDNHFNIAYFLKLVSYLVILAGFVLDYIHTYRAKETAQLREKHMQTQSTAILNSVIDGVITINSRGLIQTMNPAAQKLFGYAEDEVMGKNIKMLMPDSYGNYHDNYIKNYLATGEKKIICKGREVTGLCKDGSTFPMALSVTETTFSNVCSFTGVVRDISELKEYQDLIQSQKQYYHDLISGLGSAVLVINTDHEVIFWNKTCEKLTGINAEDIIGTRNHWRGFYRQQRPMLADLIIDKDVEAAKHYYPDYFTNNEFIETGCSIQFWTNREDIQNFYLRADCLPLRDADDNIIAAVQSITDITQLKESYQTMEQQREELERSNRELEQFAYVASHDLQEPLRMVSSYTQLLAKRYRDKLDGDAIEFIDFAVDGAVRMQNLVQDLLQYSRLSSMEQNSDTIDANDLFEYATENLAVAIDETGTVVTADDLPMIKGDSRQLKQLFQNLIGNAVKYHDPEKMNKIHVSAERSDDGWQFCIEDNGIGIEADYFEKIFVIFKRLHTKNKYQGTGIGLALCKKIIENHQGEIWLESSPGEGSRFYFTLAAAEEALPRAVSS